MNGEDAAFEAAVKLLARRALSEAEVRERLLRKGYPEEDVDRVVERLVRAGYLDDRRVALETILHHCRRGHGPIRANERLRSLAFPEDTIARAWEEAETDYGIEPRQILKDQLQRRLPQAASSCDEATVRRVYNALLRAGFEEAELRSELGSYVRDPDDAVDASPTDDDTYPPDQRSKETRADHDSQ
jgi:regulatory protein